MRIIDADEVINLIDGETKVETNSNEKAFNDALEVAIQIIDTQKTVEAIPIEWIEQYIWSADTHDEKRALRKMCIQWEKENEID